MKLEHGGDIAGYRERYGAAPIDLSANTNPLGMPEGVQKAVAQAIPQADQYPDPLCRELRRAIGKFEGVPEEFVVCGNGAADVIYRLVLAKKPRRGLVTAPAFSEYERALRLAGCQVVRHRLRESDSFDLQEDVLEAIDQEMDMVFLCNPNNPTGRLIERSLLEKILCKCEEVGALLAVDECFLGMTHEPKVYTMTGHLDRKNLLVFKAFTKQFAMAGLRLGYGLTSHKELREAMFQAGQPWSVSSLAQAAGIAAIEENEYLKKSMELLKRTKSYLLRELERIGQTQVIGHSANYIFFKTSIHGLHEKMAQRGVMIRPCGNYEGLDNSYYRIAVKTEQESRIFLKCLAELAGSRA